MFRIASFIFFCLVFLVSCSTKRFAAQMAFPLVQGQYESTQEEMDLALAAQAIPSNLKMLEGLLKGYDTNTIILNQLAEGFCSYSFSFIEDSEPRRASALYMRGRDYAIRSLAESTKVDDLVALAEEELQPVLNRMGINHLSGMFWMGQCWSGWLMLNLDNPATFADI